MCSKFGLHYYVMVYSHFEGQVLPERSAHAVWPHGRGGLRTQYVRTFREACARSVAARSGRSAHAVWTHVRGGLRTQCGRTVGEA